MPSAVSRLGGTHALRSLRIGWPLLDWTSDGEVPQSAGRSSTTSLTAFRASAARAGRVVFSIRARCALRCSDVALATRS